MSKNSKRILSAIAVGLLLSGCAFHNGFLTNSFSITNPDYRIVKYAFGRAHTTTVFGIGGLDKEALVLQAKQNMYNMYVLEKGQAFANFTVDQKMSFYFIVWTNQITVSAEVIDFNFAKIPPAKVSDEQKKDTAVNRNGTSVKGFLLNEKVTFKKFFTTMTGRIVEFQNNGALVEYTDDDKVVKTKFVSYDQLHKTN